MNPAPESHAATAGAPPFLEDAQALSCVHCGLCLGACPTYLETGDENDSPRGRVYLMRAVQSGRLDVEDARGPARHLDRCLGCRACETACPSGVPYGSMLEQTREHMRPRTRRARLDRWLRSVVIEKIFPDPQRFKWAVLPGLWVKRMDIGHLLPKFARDALDVLPEALDESPPPGVYSPPAGMARRGRVALLGGCVMPVLFGGAQRSTLRLATRLGFEVVLLDGPGCCGALHAHSGALERARTLARANLRAFEESGCGTLLVNAAGCGSTLKEYGALLAGDPLWAARAKTFSARVADISEWLDGQLWDQGKAAPVFQKAGDPGWVTYHDACHLAHAQGVTRPPRDIVKALAGDRYVELPEADVCCGSAGTYNLTEPAMAERLRTRKIRNIERVGALTVVTTNPGCILQITAGLKKQGLHRVRVVHLADFVAERLA